MHKEKEGEGEGKTEKDAGAGEAEGVRDGEDLKNEWEKNAKRYGDPDRLSAEEVRHSTFDISV